MSPSRIGRTSSGPRPTVSRQNGRIPSTRFVDRQTSKQGLASRSEYGATASVMSAISWKTSQIRAFRRREPFSQPRGPDSSNHSTSLALIHRSWWALRSCRSRDCITNIRVSYIEYKLISRGCRFCPDPGDPQARSLNPIRRQKMDAGLLLSYTYTAQQLAATLIAC
jgi:hypothetical protein